MKESGGLLLRTTSFPSPDLIKENQSLGEIKSVRRAADPAAPSVNRDVNSVNRYLINLTARRNLCDVLEQLKKLHNLRHSGQ